MSCIPASSCIPLGRIGGGVNINSPTTNYISFDAAPVNPKSVAVGTADTGGIDTSIFTRFMFILNVGVFGAGATVDMKLQQDNDPAFGTVSDVSGAAITQLLAAGGNNQLAIIESTTKNSNITKKYVRARVTVGVNATLLQCLPLGFTGNGSASDSDIAAVAERLTI